MPLDLDQKPDRWQDHLGATAPPASHRLRPRLVVVGAGALAGALVLGTALFRPTAAAPRVPATPIVVIVTAPTAQPPAATSATATAAPTSPAMPGFCKQWVWSEHSQTCVAD